MLNSEERRPMVGRDFACFYIYPTRILVVSNTVWKGCGLRLVQSYNPLKDNAGTTGDIADEPESLIADKDIQSQT